jgi:LysR family glycine cleavage system transcriptional activator
MRTLPLNALRSFEAVASRLSFTEGARALNVTPAAVSSQIRSLEQRLKQPLFHRRGREITLTNAGRRLLPGVQRGLTELHRAVRSVQEAQGSGVLNVSMAPTFLQKWLMPRLAEFHEAHPRIDLRISADDAVVDFDQSDFHAAIRFGPGRWHGLRSERLLRDWIMPVCSPDLLKDHGPLRSASDLQRFNLLYVESELWDAWFRVIGEQERDRRWPLLDDSLAILMAAEQGEGVALTRWSLVARDIEAGRLVRPIDTAVRTDWSYYFVAPPHYYELPKVTALRDWLTTQCSAFPAP